MLDPTGESYRGNKATLMAIALLGVCSGFVTSMLFGSEHSTIAKAILGLIFVGPFVGAFVWVSSVNVSLQTDRIVYKSCFGTKEMCWNDVERFYYQAGKRSVNFIPVGTYYRFTLVDNDGRKLSFGNRVEHPARGGSKLIQNTYGRVMRRLAERFDSGAEVNFGPIRASRDNGLSIKKPRRLGLGSRTERIPWTEVHDYKIADGCFYVWRVGQKRTTGPEISKIPNAFVLLGLLNAVYWHHQGVPE